MKTEEGIQVEGNSEGKESPVNFTIDDRFHTVGAFQIVSVPQPRATSFHVDYVDRSHHGCTIDLRRLQPIEFSARNCCRHTCLLATSKDPY